MRGVIEFQPIPMPCADLSYKVVKEGYTHTYGCTLLHDDEGNVTEVEVYQDRQKKTVSLEQFTKVLNLILQT